MSRQYVTAYYLDAQDGRPANEAPLRHGPVKPSENLEISAVDRRESPPLIIGSIPAGEPLAAGMTLIDQTDHDNRLAFVQAWKEANAQRDLDKQRKGMTVTKRQAKEALIRQGTYQQAVDALDVIADPTEKLISQNYWSESQTFERDNAVLNAMATDGLGMTPSELDDLFLYAATL